jgi:3-methyl-2-oxobutanoate hydroxymethyltransferase
MPFLTCHAGLEEAVRNAGRLVQQGGAHAVKVEGGGLVVKVVRRLVDAGIPVMGHLGLTPQRVHQLGGFRTQARSAEEADALLTDAAALEQAGVFAIVLEAIPSSLACRVTQAVAVPTIGIGAGPHCDGQILVTHDAVGLTDDAPSFVKRYARLAEAVVEAATSYVAEVKTGTFPAAVTRSHRGTQGRSS